MVDKSWRFLLLFWACVVARPAEHSKLDLYWVDVEGGAGTLIVTPAGESIVIDTGMPGGRDAKRIVKAAREAGLNRIDHLITTHFHIDHFGGAAEVAKELPIGTLYDNGIPENNPDNPNDNTRWNEWIKPYREMKAERRVVLKPGTSVPLKQSGDTDISLRVLAGMQKITDDKGKKPEVDCEKLTEKAKDTSDNANSLVLVLQYGAFDMFDGGDITWNTEAKLVCPENLLSTVDVYDVNHHGLDTSNNPLLVHALAPTVAIMSNGTTKGCGAETFKTLKGVPSIQAIYQIHRNLRADGENNTETAHIANMEKDCAANLIKVSVEQGGGAYTVSIPATGHSRKFTSKASR
ncbi:MAG: ComEC/Rec2 family competence protein [Limisphaerales bacterium]